MLIRFVRQQSLYIALSAVLGAVFWAIGQPINPATVMLYSLCIGNLITPAIARLRFLYAERPFPYNWLILLPLLLLLAAPVYVVSSVVVWAIAPPTPQTYAHLIRTGWKLPFLVTFVFGILTFLYQTTKDLERAREIQQSLLPKTIPQIPEFEIAGAWRPARSVSGDYYDVVRLDDHRLGICIADVVGKGVSAALLMANVQAAVRAFASNSESAAQVCTKVNLLLCENIATGKFVTFLYGVLDGETRTFQYCNAGHLLPILVTSGSVRMPEQGGAVLGVFSAWKYEDATIELKAGDRLLLFTDGITEACDGSGQEFEEGSIAAFAKANRGLAADELTGRLLARVTDYCDGQFQDDATLLVIAAS
jgi:sigma-B regulation protein RsbU (phosphoserine phosphatase)